MKKKHKALWEKKWTNFAKLACHFPGSHHFSLKFVWELLACVATVKSWLQPIDSHRAWVNLKTMDEVIGRLSFWINYSLGTISSVKPFKQSEVAKSTIYVQGSSELREPRGDRKTPCKRMACSESHQWEEGSVCQCGNGQWSSELDKKKCQKTGNSPDLCSESVKMRRAEVLQQKIYQSGFLRRPETRQ